MDNNNNFEFELPNILDQDNDNQNINNYNSNNNSNVKKYHQYSAKYRHSWVCTTEEGLNNGAKDQKELMTTFKYKTIKQTRVKPQPSTIDHLFPTLQCSNSLLKSKSTPNSNIKSNIINHEYDNKDTSSGNYEILNSRKVLKSKSAGSVSGNGGSKNVVYSLDPINSKKKNKNILLLEILEKKLYS